MGETKGPSMLPLRTVLRANSAFSIATGAALLFGSLVLDDLLGVPSGWLAALGAGVVAFGFLVRRLSEPDPVPRRSGWFVIGADVAWVLATAAVIVFFPELLTGTGTWVFGIAGLLVLDFAMMQWLALRDDT